MVTGSRPCDEGMGGRAQDFDLQIRSVNHAKDDMVMQEKLGVESSVGLECCGDVEVVNGHIKSFESNGDEENAPEA